MQKRKTELGKKKSGPFAVLGAALRIPLPVQSIVIPHIRGKLFVQTPENTRFIYCTAQVCIQCFIINI